MAYRAWPLSGKKVVVVHHPFWDLAWYSVSVLFLACPVGLVVEDRSWNASRELWIKTVGQVEMIGFYYFTHSLVAAFLVFVFLYFFLRRYLILIVSYLLYIFLDVIVHRGRFGIRFLYPFSDFYLCGFSIDDELTKNTWTIFGINLLVLGMTDFLILRGKLRDLAGKVK